MRRSLSIIFVILGLLAVGGVCLAAAMYERRMAIAQEDMAVLDFADPEADYADLEQTLERIPFLPNAR